MNALQLTIFAWVLGESLFPSMTHTDKLYASVIASFAAGYANNLHGVVWHWVKNVIRK